MIAIRMAWKIARWKACRIAIRIAWKISRRIAVRITLKGVFAKNERGYRLNAIKKRF